MIKSFEVVTVVDLTEFRLLFRVVFNPGIILLAGRRTLLLKLYHRKHANKKTLTLEPEAMAYVPLLESRKRVF